jgi:hypothetical protein
LYGSQDLRALSNGVVSREQNLQVEVQVFRGPACRGGLLQLKVVLFRHQRQQKAALGGQLNSPVQDELNSRSAALEYTRRVNAFTSLSKASQKRDWWPAKQVPTK